MFISLLLVIGSFIIPVSAYAEAHQLLSCRDFEWIAEGVRDNDIISEVTRSEIMIQLIESTDPKCFEDQDANVDEGTGNKHPILEKTMNTLALIKKQIKKAAALHDAQISHTTYRGVDYEICATNDETHGTFCYRGRTYTK